MSVWSTLVVRELYMSKIILGDAEYEYDDLSANAKANVDSIKYVENQINQKKQEIAVLSAAKAMYSLALKESIEGAENKEVEKDNWIDNLGDTIQFD